MKFFVTGVNGQLGHDVMNELSKRGHEGVGSDLGETYAGVQDGSAVTTMPYVSLDITDQAAVKKQIMEIKPDAVIHCAAWTAGVTWHAGSNPAVSANKEKSSQHCISPATLGGFDFSIKYLLPSNICLPHLSRLEVARSHFLQASSCPGGCCMVLPPC